MAAQPGTAVEAGGLVARLIDPTRVLVRLDLPPEVAANGPPAEIELAPGAPFPVLIPRGAKLVGAAPQTDASSQLPGFYYTLHLDPRTVRPLWRPGQFVRTELPVSGAEPVDAVSVPASAVLYHQGRALVYIKADNKFERREVRVLGQEGGRCVVARKSEFSDPLSAPNSGIQADDLVVVRNPQVLLSLEFRRDVDDD